MRFSTARSILGPPRVRPVARAVELLGHQLPVPAENRLGLSNLSDFSQTLSPEPFADSARVPRSALVSHSLTGACVLRMRFSATRYSTCSSSSEFTIPVTYVSRRATSYAAFIQPASSQAIDSKLTVNLYHTRKRLGGLLIYYSRAA